jgi:hypothetical protein
LARNISMVRAWVTYRRPAASTTGKQVADTLNSWTRGLACSQEGPSNILTIQSAVTAAKANS